MSSIETKYDMKIDRSKGNFIIDAMAFAGFVLLATTGVLMRYVLPPGSGRSKVIWGLDRHEWGSLHFIVSLVLLCVLSIHLVLHWRWVVSFVKGRPREGSGMRAGLGIVGLVGFLALSVTPLFSPVETTRDLSERHEVSSAYGEDPVQITGSMTLSEIEQKTDVPASYIIEKLNLPSSVDRKERLGILKKTYGFTVENVRRIVREYEREK